MGIQDHFFKQLHNVMTTVLHDAPNKKVLCLGYPDMLVSEQTMLELYSSQFVSTIPEDPLPDEVRHWHNYPSNLFVYDPLFILNHHVFEVTIFDALIHRGIETVVDLNEPFLENYKEQFDLIIDTGTLEHCFNAGTAFKNICQSVKKDGVFMTIAPMTKLAHGYYNFCPELYQDGFGFNGFKALYIEYLDPTLVPLSNRKFKVGAPNGSVMFYICQRDSVVDFRWPIQKKYRNKIK